MFSLFKCNHTSRKLVEGTKTLVCQDCGHVSAIPCEHVWNGCKDAPAFLQCIKCGDVKPVDIKGHTCVYDTIKETRIFEEEGSLRPSAYKFTLRCKICGNIKHSTCS